MGRNCHKAETRFAALRTLVTFIKDVETKTRTSRKIRKGTIDLSKIMPPFGSAVTLAQPVPTARFEVFERKTSDIALSKIAISSVYPRLSHIIRNCNPMSICSAP